MWIQIQILDTDIDINEDVGLNIIPRYAYGDRYIYKALDLHIHVDLDKDRNVTQIFDIE